MSWQKAFEMNPNANTRMSIEAVSDLTQLLMFPDNTELIIVQMGASAVPEVPAVSVETVNVNEHFRAFVRDLIAKGTSAESIMFVVHLPPADLAVPPLVSDTSENTPKGD